MMYDMVLGLPIEEGGAAEVVLRADARSLRSSWLGLFVWSDYME